MALYIRTPWLSVNSGTDVARSGTRDARRQFRDCPGHSGTVGNPNAPPGAWPPAPGKGNLANHNKITIMIVFVFAAPGILNNAPIATIIAKCKFYSGYGKLTFSLEQST